MGLNGCWLVVKCPEDLKIIWKIDTMGQSEKLWEKLSRLRSKWSQSQRRLSNRNASSDSSSSAEKLDRIKLLYKYTKIC